MVIQMTTTFRFPVRPTGRMLVKLAICFSMAVATAAGATEAFVVADSGKRDMLKRNFIDLEVTDDSLLIEAKRRAFGIMPNETVNVAEFSHVEVDWGVNVFPEGTSYEQGVRNEAIMIFFFMGDERLPSGSIFIPDSPYFIGLYLCNDGDRMNHPYLGTYFKKSGRFVCSDRPADGETVTSRFDLLEGYRTFFDKERDDDPGISGLAIALDTRKAGNRGKSSAFIKEIRIYQ